MGRPLYFRPWPFSKRKISIFIGIPIRPLYRGEVVWNRSQKIVRAGTKKQRKRDESEWLTLPAPDLRIISDDLWHRVKERLQRSGAIYARTSSGRLLSRPRHRDESAYLLTGFARCSVCGGTIGTDLRAHGSAGSRAHIPHYGCLDHKRRGAAVCTNSVGLNQRLLDQAILASISALLDEHVLGAAVDRACSKLTVDVEKHRTQMMSVEREHAGIQLRIERLLDALADGSLPRDEVAGRLNTEKSRKDTLTAERDRLTRVLRATDVDAARIKAELLVKVQDVKALLGRHIPQARQMLRKLLADKIELEPVGQGRERGYKFRGALTVDRLIAGDTLAKPETNNTSDGGGPNGIRTRVSALRGQSLAQHRRELSYRVPSRGAA